MSAFCFSEPKLVPRELKDLRLNLFRFKACGHCSAPCRQNMPMSPLTFQGRPMTRLLSCAENIVVKMKTALLTLLNG
ncbi:hypothetical protein D3C87_1796560 [compost metagenome]